MSSSLVLGFVDFADGIEQRCSKYARRRELVLSARRGNTLTFKPIYGWIMCEQWEVLVLRSIGTAKNHHVGEEIDKESKTTTL
jgi:hypothetical protein